MPVRIWGIIDNCLNCGAPIGPDVFPHYCENCITYLHAHGRLPPRILEQIKLESEQDDRVD